MKITKTVIAVIAGLTLTACGGGGGSDDSPTPPKHPTPTVETSGVFVGPDTNGGLNYTILLKTGELYDFIKDGGSQLISGIAHGQLSFSPSDLEAKNVKVQRYIFGSGQTPEQLTVDLTLSKSGIVGTFTDSQDRTASINLDRQNLQNVSLSSIAGHYAQGVFINADTASNSVTVDIDNSGHLTAIDGAGCKVTGAFTQSQVTGVFLLNATYENNAVQCGNKYAGESVTGVAYYDGSSKLIAAMHNASKTVVVAYQGIRNG